MCGGGQSSTSTVSIPPEVLKNYQESFARGKQVAEKPFQEYSKDPNAFVAGMTPTQQAALDNINAIQGMATPDVQEGQGYIRQGMEEGRGLQGESLGTAQQGQGIGSRLYGQSLGTMSEGQGIGSQLYGRSLGTSGAGLSDARQIYGQALPGIQRAAATGENYAQDAAARLYAGLNQAQPYMGEAANLTRMGLGAGQQYAGMAGGYLGAGTQGVGPGAFNPEQYMSPYLNQVVRAQQALQAEENQTQRSALRGEAIRAGAFGGDRAGIAQANLARQQSLANQATLSNLLQQGYGQAQGVAGQQQQVDLGAAQANRAAQQFGAQQAAALGQQQFGQGLSAAQQQAALGQALYAQNIGQGQAIASLGQQQYGQGLGSAQAAAGMGKDIYGMSAQEAQLQQAAAQGMFGQAAQSAQLQQAAAQGMFGQAAQVAALQQSAGNNIFNYGYQGGQGIANLGLANQQAQMQAAQAQMQMGQVQQQTDQAGKTAMYNQFTQQQGYPYQQAQFLANLATATGALSGSTTTTNSSGGGFLSDRRLKDNAEKIGETFDGQAIYRYNYKGEDHMQIGMMAQDVEKHNPDAVGRSQGYKTLDYEKATDKAAERGHFYSGGLVPASMGGAVSPDSYYESFARGGYAEGGDAGQWSLVRKTLDEDGNDRGGPDQWTNSATGEIRYGSDPSIAEAAAAKKTASELDPRINAAYQTNVFRDATADEAEAFQDRLTKGDSIGSITSDIANSREKNLVNQTPLTYDASKFAQYASPVRNRYGAAAAPASYYGTGANRSSFDPGPARSFADRYAAFEAGSAAAAPPIEEGYARRGSGFGGNYRIPDEGMPQAVNYGGGYGGGYGQQFGGGYGQQFGGGYGQQMGGYGQQFGGGYGQQMGGYGGGYGGGYQQPSQMSQFAQGFMGGYQPMPQPQASGKGVGPSSYQSNYGYSSPYGMGAPNPSSYNMGASAPQASGKGPSSSGSGGAQAFRDGGRIGYALGGGSHVDANDLAKIAAQRMMELAPHAAGMPGQTMPGAQSYVSNKQLYTPNLIVSKAQLPAQKNPFDQAISMAGKINSVGDAFSDKGLIGRAINRLTPASSNDRPAGGASGAGGAPVVASSSEPNLPDKSAAQASYEFGPSDNFRIPGYDPNLDYASGGLVPHYGLGGSLPYGGSAGGGGYIPEELLQPQQIQGLPKNDAELRSAAAKATAGGSGGLGDVMKAGNLGYKLAPESLKTSLRSIFPGATPTTPAAGLGAGAEAAPIAAANATAPAAEAAAAAALPAAAETAAAAAAPVAAEAVAGLGGAAAAEAAAAAAAAASAALPAAATAATVAAPAAAEGLMALLAMLPFSDRRLKENIDPVGKTYDGQTIYRYNFKGDDRTQVGLIAQEVEKRHKDAVGSSRGMKTVDYKRATEDAADRGHFYNGGLVPYRRGYAEGMTVDEADLPAIGAQDVERQENPLAPLINRTAEKIGVKPVDLGTAISYETAGTFDPWKRGPTTKWGEHRGLLQWGEPQRKQYGVTQDSTLEQQMDAAGRYLVDRGVKPGMGLKDIYSAINAGYVGRYNASDERAGGAPGTVEDKVAGMGDHRAKAARLLGIDLGNTDRTDAGRAVALAKQPSDGSFPIRPPATAKGKEQDWSDFITSKQFILPALTAIATMGTTPTRNLGTALSAGLLGGVTSYQNLDKTLAEQELESRKVSSTEQTTRTNTFTKNMQLLEVLNRRASSYKGRGENIPPELLKQIEDITKQLTESGAGQSLTSGAAVLGPPKTTTTGRVEAATPVAGKPTTEVAKPDEKKTGTEGTRPAASADPTTQKPVPEVPTINQALSVPSSGTSNSEFLSKLDPNFNPVELNKRASEMAGYDAEASRVMADKAIAIQQEMNRTGFGTAIGGGLVPIPGHADEKVLRDAAPKLHESFEQQSVQYRGRQIAKDQLTQIAESLSYIQSGKGVPAINAFVAGMITAGFKNLIPESPIVNPKEAEKIAKLAWEQVFSRLMLIGGQPRVLEMQGLQASGVNLGLQPEANKAILANALASFNYEDKYFEDAVKAYKEQGYKYSDSAFMPEWRRNNRLDALREEAEKNLAIRGATPVNDNGSINFNKLKDGYTYVIEADQMPGVTKPTKYRVTRDKDGKRRFEEVR